MTRKVRVLQFGNAMGLYGAERWILALIKYLDENKIESQVVSVKDGPHLDVEICIEAEKLGFPVEIISSYGKMSFSAILQLRQYIISNKIDIIHTHHYKTDIIGLLATIGTSCKCVSTPHGWTKKPDQKLWCYEMIDRLIFPFFNAIVPLSENLYTSLSRLPWLKWRLRYIRNGVDIGEIEEINETDEKIEELKSEGRLIIGYIGRLITGKGLDILLKAVAKYGEPHWTVVIIGEGEIEDELRRMADEYNIREQVEIIGFRPDRLAFLKGFDTFVLPSRSEGIPRCVMEAMAARVPVVASDIPGCRQLIDGKNTGLLFDLEDLEQLADSIKRICSDGQLREAVIKNAHEFVNRNYSAVRMAKEYESLFFELCES